MWIARRPPGYAFVDFDDSRDPEDAIHELDEMDASWIAVGTTMARPRRGDVVGNIEAPRGIDRGGGHESTDLDFIRMTKIMSILIVCSSQFLVVGIILSLHAATKISSRAQGIAIFASRWHALMTCSSNDSPHNRSSDSLVNFEAANRLSSLHTSYSE